MLYIQPTPALLSYENIQKLSWDKQTGLYSCPQELEEDLSNFLLENRVFPLCADAALFLEYDILIKKYSRQWIESLELVLGNSGAFLHIKSKSLRFEKKLKNSHSDYINVLKFFSWAWALSDIPLDISKFVNKHFCYKEECCVLYEITKDGTRKNITPLDTLKFKTKTPQQIKSISIVV
jgi:hypothetical protein